MRKSFKFKIYQSRTTKHLGNRIGISGKIYNHCIALHKRYYKLYGKHLNANNLKKHITKLKKLNKYKFWTSVNSQAIQDITERIDKGYKRFFDNVKARKERKIKERVSPPNFKKVKKYKSFTLKQCGWKLEENGTVVINKRRYKYDNHRDIQGNVKTVTIKRDAVGDYWVIFSCILEDETEKRIMTGESAGFDFGLKTFLACSEDNNPINSPLFFKKHINEIKKANRNLSRKKKGSNHRKRARTHLARKHRRISNLRNDYQWKLAGKLSAKYDYLFFEDLNIKAMCRLWGRKVHDLGFSDFMRKIEFKSKELGSHVHKIGRFYPSSKECCNCGNIKKDLKLKNRIYVCFECGIIICRDENAAINIKMVGASAIGLEIVRPFLGGLVNAKVFESQNPLMVNV